MTVRVDSGASSATVLYVNTASAQPQVTTDSTGKWTFANLTALYVDGVSISSGSTVASGEWHHVLAVFPESLAAVYVGNNVAGTAGYPMRIGHLATYSDAVSATDALTIYKAWVGAPSLSLSDPGVINIHENAPTVPRTMGLMTVGSSGSSSGADVWAFPKAVLATNPGAYWRLEESASVGPAGGSIMDWSNGHTTAVCMYGMTTGATGLLGGPSATTAEKGLAASWNGTGQPLINVTGGAAGTGGPAFSVACIIQTSDSTNQMFTWNRMGSIAVTHAWWMGVTAGSPILRTYGGGDSQALGLMNVADGKPHFLVGTFAVGSQAKIYVDGVLVATGVTSTGLANQSQGLQLGANSEGVSGASPWNGIIDEAIYWNREISAAEVKTMNDAITARRQPLFRGYANDWAIVSGG